MLQAFSIIWKANNEHNSIVTQGYIPALSRNSQQLRKKKKKKIKDIAIVYYGATMFGTRLAQNKLQKLAWTCTININSNGHWDWRNVVNVYSRLKFMVCPTKTSAWAQLYSRNASACVHNVHSSSARQNIVMTLTTRQPSVTSHCIHTALSSLHPNTLRVCRASVQHLTHRWQYAHAPWQHDTATFNSTNMRW